MTAGPTGAHPDAEGGGGRPARRHRRLGRPRRPAAACDGGGAPAPAGDGGRLRRARLLVAAGRGGGADAPDIPAVDLEPGAPTPHRTRALPGAGPRAIPGWETRRPNRNSRRWRPHPRRSAQPGGRPWRGPAPAATAAAAPSGAQLPSDAVGQLQQDRAVGHARAHRRPRRRGPNGHGAHCARRCPRWLRRPFRDPVGRGRSPARQRDPGGSGGQLRGGAQDRPRPWDDPRGFRPRPPTSPANTSTFRRASPRSSPAASSTSPSWRGRRRSATCSPCRSRSTPSSRRWSSSRASFRS